MIDAGTGLYRYWGKWGGEGRRGYHLLVYHSLDVAACCERLLMVPEYSLCLLSEELGWATEVVNRMFVACMALHDIGKFAPGFQNLAPGLSSELIQCDRAYTYNAQEARHDTLGWLLWSRLLAEQFPGSRQKSNDLEFWEIWMRAATGHHGKPPKECTGGGILALRWQDHFAEQQKKDALEFAQDVGELFLPGELPSTTSADRQVLKKHSWRLAGLGVLADWLASDSTYFSFRIGRMDLQEYWQKIARPAAERAVRGAGLQEQLAGDWRGAKGLFPAFSAFTPLQRYAEEVELALDPQLFLLEDVTGAGKTEAALILTHRLIAAGRASGAYVALPTMATANQQYARVGRVYRHLYADEADPSLVLAHGARRLVTGFRQSIVRRGDAVQDSNYAPELSGGAQCASWLADHGKKALLANVGVGTVDQALLAILPVRHQSLRLLGLAGKVLVVDEVHAYDAYTATLLERLLEAHARQGGSAILLSATVPSTMRQKLIAAYCKGRGVHVAEVATDLRYPLATQTAIGMVRTAACETRTQLIRTVKVEFQHSEERVLGWVADEAAAGRCVCWIRNTVEDVRRAATALQGRIPAGSLQVFHSRFAMGDRLQIEDRVVRSFGARSTARERRGRVLVASQVVEQSLDLDFDCMVSDLAPIDLLIQRAGRLQRHSRSAEGERASDGIERRPAPVLHVLAPEWDEDPPANWYTRLFPKARFVYPDTGQLWRTQHALLQAGRIMSPGKPGEPGGVRGLVESVYGVDAVTVPEKLLHAAQEQLGQAMAEISQANFLGLNTARAYSDDENSHWYEESSVPTRLGEESQTVYLARVEKDSLLALIESEVFPWEYSAVRIDKRQLSGLATHWQMRHSAALESLRRYPLLQDAFVLPLERDERGWQGVGERRGAPVKVRYNSRMGLELEPWGEA